MDNIVNPNDNFASQAQTFKDCIDENLKQRLAKDEIDVTEYERYMSVSYSVVDHMIERWIVTQKTYAEIKPKRIFYISMEFLMGRTLSNSLICLGLYDIAKEALLQMGLDMDEIANEEGDAGLGNGGLGRLAACYLDSMANIGIPSHGYGLRYEYGMFNQHIVNGKQIEKPDNWLANPYPWEVARISHKFTVHFGGQVTRLSGADTSKPSIWEPREDVIAMASDTPICGFANANVNVLRLWSAHATEEFNLDYFSTGDYMSACENQVITENITKVLYPNDNVFEGKELRLKQEYLLVSASISDILKIFTHEHGMDFNIFPDKVGIQLNDTHPSLAIAELMRVFIDFYDLPWDKAWDITKRTFAYTNHTLLPEALEEWPVSLMEALLPRHMEIIYNINYFFTKDVSMKYPGDVQKLKNISIIAEDGIKRVRMAYLSVIGSHKVNGVAKLHSNLVTKTIFKDFAEYYPDKFTNVTNGITPRRWILNANPEMTELINSAIGDDWNSDLEKIIELENFTSDSEFIHKWMDVKENNKIRFMEFLAKDSGLLINPNNMFDVQVKRIHEYKRQLLFLLYIIGRYLEIKDNSGASIVHRTYMIGGKAAPGYWKAKQIIYFINMVADFINRDPETKGKIKLVFLPNYRVTLAESVIPAADLSEQISTAGYEASGTGNMKFALNGALTIGTLDGANIEIKDNVGDENIFIFGHTSDQVMELKRQYNPQEYIADSPLLQKIIRLIQIDYFNQGDPGAFKFILDDLMSTDQYMLMADFDMYYKKQSDVDLAYRDKIEWAKKSILNVARCGYFSSDRAINEYAKNIWNVKPIPIQKTTYAKNKR